MLSCCNPTTGRLDYRISTPRSTTIPGVNTTKKICRILSLWPGCYTTERSSTILFPRTTSGYWGGSDTTMDYIGQMRGHLQDEYGAMYYWLTRFPWCTDTKTDRYHGQPPPSIYPS
eukprot:8581696-Pyramimonas_sp.AAC.1